MPVATPPPPPPIVINSPAPLQSVVSATERYDWPHRITLPEQMDIAHAVMASFVTPSTGALVCRWPTGYAGRAFCGVVLQEHGKIHARFRVNVRVWEDGSYRLTRVIPRKR